MRTRCGFYAHVREVRPPSDLGFRESAASCRKRLGAGRFRPPRARRRLPAKRVRAVTDSTPSSKSGGQVLDRLKAWLPIVTVIVGAAWAAFVYFDQRDPPARPAAVAAGTAPATATNPELERRKIAAFTEVSQLAATLANEPVESETWKTAETRFRTLYWGEMSIHEKGAVEDRMVKFGRALDAHKDAPSPETSADLREASLKLAHALRDELAAPE